MSSAVIGVFVALIVAVLLFASGYATLILPEEKALRLPLAGRINQAFGSADTLRFVRLIAGFLMVVAVMLVIASLASLLNSVRLFVP
ncbi:MAG: hypothetical protein RMM31_00080 [Anaerolineae bacterium]|nr:hypothetical protein [Thermoflexales bacterium]MDW8394623.1 hypothetical protein [Anaerolineae bacterium]